ncbi:hypothetical protein D9758_004771 [Tetrapyrgos nigripes]|uniref:Yeast cell wall synthesis Kre9/Knh1-like N-terminal domain-containing protein n=1 Tax=Tetrapyrgos nigripes TaxID=182062 RepID=A0A8H5LJ52_9AGAR|nr:hypothetical protein D9758_004771 [Tetrapyrgos nigripes]
MRSFVTLCLALAASTAAYQVIVPNPTQGWTNQGEQPVSWDMVSTDASNFTILLTNTDRSVMPIDNQVLAAQVDGSLKSTNVRPPANGWLVGGSYRVNLVKSETEQSTIYAQSDEFDIKESTSSSASGSATTPTGSRTTMVASNTAANTAANTASTGSTETSLDQPSTPTNAALSNGVQNGVAVGLVALFAAFMA